MLNGENILIENCSGIGDAIMFTPALRRIKELYPQTEISFVTKSVNAGILAELPYIDHVYSMDRKNTFHKLKIMLKLWKQDYVIFTNWQPQLALAAYLFRIPHRISIHKEKYENTTLFHKYIKTWVLDTRRYAADVIADELGKALDIKLDADTTHCDVSASNDKTERAITELFKNKGIEDKQYILLAPFASAPERNWQIEDVKKFIEKTNENNFLPVVIVGDYNNSFEIEQINNAINLVGQTSLLELIEIVKRASLFIGTDSGPMHIAGALGIEGIALFTKDISERWLPKKCTPISLHLPCSPCGDEQARVCKSLACMRGITYNMVFDIVKEKLMKQVNCNAR